MQYLDFLLFHHSHHLASSACVTIPPLNYSSLALLPLGGYLFAFISRFVSCSSFLFHFVIVLHHADYKTDTSVS